MTPEFAVYAGLLLARLGAFRKRDAAVWVAHAAPRARRVRACDGRVYLSTAPPELAKNAKPAGEELQIESLRYTLAILREGLIGAAMGFAFSLFCFRCASRANSSLSKSV